MAKLVSGWVGVNGGKGRKTANMILTMAGKPLFLPVEIMDNLQNELKDLKGFIAELKADRAETKEKEKRESWTKYVSLTVVNCWSVYSTAIALPPHLNLNPPATVW